MKYVLKPAQVEAEQWKPDCGMANVQQMDPELIFSLNGKYYYLSALGDPKALADCWLPIGDGPALPFAFWELKSGERKPAAQDPKLAQKYLAHLGLTDLPPAYGLAEPLEARTVVMPGDWVLTDADGARRTMKPADFEAAYEAA